MPAKGRNSGSRATGAGRAAAAEPGAEPGIGTGARATGISKKTDAARKRTQNRIAQQCVRERHAASNRIMSDVLETLRSASEADESQRYAILLESHMKLVRHNQLLEDALLRMRKKLLSLANSASLAADDPVFDIMLGRGEQERPPAPDVSASIGQSALSVDNSTCPSVNAELRQEDVDVLAAVSVSAPPQTPGILLGEVPPQPGLDSSYEGLGDFSSAPPFLTTIPATAPAVSLFPPDAAMPALDEAPSPPPDSFSDAALFMPPGFFPLSDVSKQPPELGHGHDRIPNWPWDISTRSTSHKISIQSCYEFNSSMLRAASRCMSRVQNLLGLRHLTTDQVAQQVAVAAVNLITAASGTQDISYGINGAAYLERVLYWRLVTGDPDVVPGPFRPTPLQCGLSLPNPVVDYMGWPEIRDQIILAGQNVDLDEMFRSIMRNMVVEIPQQKVAVNISKYFEGRAHRQRMSRDMASSKPPFPPSTDNHLQTPSSALDPGWVYFEIGPGDPDYEPSVPDPVEEGLTRQLCRLVQRFTRSQLFSLFPETSYRTDGLLGVPESPMGFFNPRFRKDDMMTSHGVPNINVWKLSKDFGQRYPFLDCSTVCTTYETVS